jgi:hypothetical protein
MIASITKRLRSMIDEPSPSVGADDHHVDRIAVVIRDVEPDGCTPWGKSQELSDRVGMRGIQDHGVGFVESRAWDHVKERIDPYEVPAGTHVATLVVDMDEWDYRVEWTDEGQEYRG